MNQKQVARALGGGLAEVLDTGHGVGKGVRASSAMLLVVGASPKLIGWLNERLGRESLPMRPFVLCRTCDTPEMMPATPTSQGLNGKGEPLFAPGTSGHALHVLTWLHDFARHHVHDTVNTPENVNR